MRITIIFEGLAGLGWLVVEHESQIGACKRNLRHFGTPAVAVIRPKLGPGFAVKGAR